MYIPLNKCIILLSGHIVLFWWSHKLILCGFWTPKDFMLWHLLQMRCCKHTCGIWKGYWEPTDGGNGSSEHPPPSSCPLTLTHLYKTAAPPWAPSQLCCLSVCLSESRQTPSLCGSRAWLVLTCSFRAHVSTSAAISCIEMYPTVILLACVPMTPAPSSLVPHLPVKCVKSHTASNRCLNLTAIRGVILKQSKQENFTSSAVSSLPFNWRAEGLIVLTFAVFM